MAGENVACVMSTGVIEFFLHGLIYDFINVPWALKKKTYSVIRI